MGLARESPTRRRSRRAGARSASPAFAPFAFRSRRTISARYQLSQCEAISTFGNALRASVRIRSFVQPLRMSARVRCAAVPFRPRASPFLAFIVLFVAAFVVFFVMTAYVG